MYDWGKNYFIDYLYTETIQINCFHHVHEIKFCDESGVAILNYELAKFNFIQHSLELVHVGGGGGIIKLRHVLLQNALKICNLN